MRYTDRKDAALAMLPALERYRGTNAVLLAIPRGGIPLAYTLAKELQLPVELLMTKKIGHPDNPEFAIGAVSPEDYIVDERSPVSQRYIDNRVTAIRQQLQERYRLLEGERRPADLRGKILIVIDDGIATGKTILSSIAMLRRRDPEKIVVAAPVSSQEAASQIERLADELVCPYRPAPFRGVGEHYEDFSAVSDESAKALLEELRSGDPVPEAAPGEDPDTDLLRRVSLPLTKASDLDALIDAIGDARYVLLGEASHGTHEYYTWRSRITQRLLEEKGFSFVAVEGDWPDCYRLNRYIKGYPDSGKSAAEVLYTFDRWPTWMWANWETVALAEWLHTFNQTRPQERKAGFYGLDVYSLWESMEAIIRYLEQNDPPAVARVKEAMECFEPYNVREGFSSADLSYGLLRSCEGAVTRILDTIRERMHRYSSDPEAAFNAEQNALVAVHAEQYFQVMLRGGPDSWNIRDRHMNETLNRLMELHGPDARAVVWEHNTHIGDARATDMYKSGLVNVGQLVEEEHGTDCVFRVGFGSYEGSVIAAAGWDRAMQEMPLPPAPPGSWEDLLHRSGDGDRLLFSKDIAAFSEPIGHRAVGVVYHPSQEHGNYVPSILPKRYEAFIYLDRTQALHPLHIRSDSSEIPETYPWGV